MSEIVTMVGQAKTDYSDSTKAVETAASEGCFGILLEDVLGGAAQDDMDWQKNSWFARDETDMQNEFGLEREESSLDRMEGSWAGDDYRAESLLRDHTSVYGREDSTASGAGQAERTSSESAGTESAQNESATKAADGTGESAADTQTERADNKEEAAETVSEDTPAEESADKGAVAEEGKMEGAENEEIVEQDETVEDAVVDKGDAPQEQTPVAENGQEVVESSEKASAQDEDALDGEEEVADEGEMLDAEQDGELADSGTNGESAENSAAALAAQQVTEKAGTKQAVETKTFAQEVAAMGQQADKAGNISGGADAAGTLSSQTLQGGSEVLQRIEQWQSLADRFDMHVLSLIKDGADAMRITINPEQFGTLVVDCREGDDGMTVHVQAENAAVCNLLQQQESGLRTALEQNGFKLSEFDVSAEGEEARGDERGRQMAAKDRNEGEHAQQNSYGGRQSKAVEDAAADATPVRRVSTDGVWLVA